KPLRNCLLPMFAAISCSAFSLACTESATSSNSRRARALALPSAVGLLRTDLASLALRLFELTASCTRPALADSEYNETPASPLSGAPPTAAAPEEDRFAGRAAADANSPEPAPPFALSGSN